MIYLILITFTPALLVYFLDYTFGRPKDEQPDYSAVLFRYTYFLSSWKLKRLGAWDGLKRQYVDNMRNAKSEISKAEINRSFKEVVLQSARPHFTFENAIGMCAVCTHFWAHWIVLFIIHNRVNKNIFLENNFYFENYLLTFVLPLLAGHLLIRTFKKFI